MTHILPYTSFPYLEFFYENPFFWFVSIMQMQLQQQFSIYKCHMSLETSRSSKKAEEGGGWVQGQSVAHDAYVGVGFD